MSRQAYYQSRSRSEQRQISERELVRAIMDIRSCDPRIGALKLWLMLKHTFEGNLYGRDRLIDFMHRYGLMLKRKPRIHTTNSNHRYRKYKNCIKELEVKEANQLWVSDITYIPIDGQVLYLHLVTDAYSRRIMGAELAPSLHAEHSLTALEKAVSVATPEALRGTIHHSDRGCQYCSYDYTGRLKELGMSISMTEDSNPTDNAIAERVNGVIKYALEAELKACKGLEEARKLVYDYIVFYNERRPHMSLDNKTPLEAYCEVGKQRKRWKGRNPQGSSALNLQS